MGRGRRKFRLSGQQAYASFGLWTGGGREGRPEVDHAIHMIIDVGRSGERRRLRSSFKIQQQSSGQAEMAANRREEEKEGGLAFHNVS